MRFFVKVVLLFFGFIFSCQGSLFAAENTLLDTLTLKLSLREQMLEKIRDAREPPSRFPVEVRKENIIFLPLNKDLLNIQQILFPELKISDYKHNLFINYGYHKKEGINPEGMPAEETVIKMALIAEKDDGFYLLEEKEKSGGVPRLDILGGLEAEASLIVEKVIGYARGLDLDKSISLERRKEALKSALGSEYQSDRANAIESFTNIGDPAVPDLISVLKGGNLVARDVAKQTLIKIGRPATTYLVDLLKEGELKGTVPEIVGAIRDERATEALVNLLKDSDLYVRESAVLALGKIKDPKTVGPLVNILKEPKVNESISAVVRDALTKIGSVGIPLLVEALKDESGAVRRNVALVLENLKWKPQGGEETVTYLIALGKWEEVSNLGPDAFPYLVANLKIKDARIRSGAASALGKFKEPKAVTSLIERLADEDDAVREAAAIALGAIGDPQAVGPLINILQTPNYRVRQMVINALGAIGDPQAVVPLLDFLKDKNPLIRNAAAMALGTIRDSQAIPALVNTLKTDLVPEVRKSSAEALVQIGKQAIPSLVSQLKDESSTFRKNVALVLEELGWEPQEKEEGIFYLMAAGKWEQITSLGPEALPYLKMAVQDKDAKVRAGAATTLSGFKEQEVVYTLIRLLNDVDDMVRNVAIRSLGAIKDPEAVYPLAITLKDSNPGIRSAAAGALGDIGDRHAVHFLITTLSKDKEYLVRIEALKALGKIKDAAAVIPLIDSLKDANNDIRKASAAALGEIKDPQAVPLLVPLLEDLDYSVRKSVKDSLTKMGKVAVPYLITTLEDRGVRKEVVEVLTEITNKRFGYDYDAWKNWWEEKSP
ncbi:MAG: HEAT repeat domain-containing protein [Candidatus Omnitrophota bacterium]